MNLIAFAKLLKCIDPNIMVIKTGSAVLAEEGFPIKPKDLDIVIYTKKKSEVRNFIIPLLDQFRDLKKSFEHYPDNIIGDELAEHWKYGPEKNNSFSVDWDIWLSDNINMHVIETKFPGIYRHVTWEIIKNKARLHRTKDEEFLTKIAAVVL